MRAIKGSIYLVVAPSGAGKTSLVAALLKADRAVKLSISYTTRTPRAGEVDGEHYHFVSFAEFSAMQERGEFLEYAQVYGQYYASSAPWMSAQLEKGVDVLLEIDWQGVRQVRALFPQAISIFILPPSLAELERRLRARATDKEEMIAQRLAAARSEITRIKEYDYIIFNDCFEQARDDLISVVRSQRLRASLQIARHTARLAKLSLDQS